MKSYEEIVREYRKRQRDTLVDTLAAGLSYMDEIAVDSGVLEETGLLSELTGSVCGALPFVIIAATEGTKIILGRKPTKTGVKDGAYRMVKTGAALGVGAAVMGAAGFWAALPVTMGVRALFDSYKSKALTGRRVRSRITRLQELNRNLRREESGQTETAPAQTEAIPAQGSILPAEPA